MGTIKFPLQSSHSNLNLFKCYLLVFHTLQSHGSMSDSKQLYLGMLSRMNTGNSHTSPVLCCCWGFPPAVWKQWSLPSIWHKPVRTIFLYHVLQSWSLRLLSLRSQTGIFSCPSVILSPAKCDTSEIHDVWLRAEESSSLFKEIDSILSVVFLRIFYFSSAFQHLQP